MTENDDHVWSQENIAAYVAGGLSALEAARLQVHLRDCFACSELLSSARAFDSGLAHLFADVHPGADLEDRVVVRLRTTSHRPLLAGWVKRTVAAAAALIILGTVGAFVGPAVASGMLRMPGQTASVPPQTNELLQREDRGGSTRTLGEASENLTNEDGGMQSDLNAAMPELSRLNGRIDKADVTFEKHGRSYGFNLPAVDGSVSNLSDKQLNSLGYYPPSRGLIIKGNNWYRSSADSKLSGAFDFNESGNDRDKTRSLSSFTADGQSVVLGDGLFKNAQFDPIAKPDISKTPAVVRFDPLAHKPALGNTTVGKTVTLAVPVTVTRTVTETSGKPEQQKGEPEKVAEPEPKPKAPPVADPQPMKRVILRSGEIEFEVDSFETASASVQKLVDGVKGAYIATINSEKLANGKMKGSITVRVPPEQLDGLVAGLRKELDKNGGLKGVRIGSSDVTKQYYDIESRLKAARTMEERLLKIIKDGKGDIKALVEAEQALGSWRTKIEEYEGEIRYYNNLAALSTLTITITEKEIRAAAALIERERVQAGVEVEDVEKAYQEVLKAVAEAKGRVTKSEMKQVTAGQFNATINFEVAPEAAGPVRDRLNQLGRLARLEIDRLQEAEGGTTPTTAKPKRGDTVFLVQLYNLANIEPRETATLQLAVVDVPTAYQALRDAVAKASGRVLVAQLNEQDRQNVTAQFDFEVRRADDAAIRVAFDAAGEVVGRQVTRAAESASVTDAKVRYNVALLAANRLKPREIFTLEIEVADVDAAAASFALEVADAKGRQADSRTTRQPDGRVVSKVVYLVPLSAAATLAQHFKAAGTPRLSQSVRDPQATEGRYAVARIDVTLSNAEGIVAEDRGVWQQVRRGLKYSASVLLTSVTWLVFGLCVVLPWALIAYGGYRVVRGRSRGSSTVATAPPAPPPAA